MKRSLLIIYSIIFLVITLLSTDINSQNLVDGPESVAFDSLNNRYLVSSLRTNKIISIDKEGNQSVFKEGITAFGNCIRDGVFYVSGNASVKGLDVTTGELLMTVTIPGVTQFDGITIDNSGNLYALATRIGKVYKINLSTLNYWIFVDSGFGTAPQDLIYDKFKNRILVCLWHAASPIMAISLADSSLTTVAENTAGFADGITIDQEGSVYVGSYEREGEIYKYDNDFSSPGELIYIGVEEPAGLDYNIIDDVLAVPSFSGDRIEFINMPATYIFPNIQFDVSTGHAPLNVEFTDLSGSNPLTNNWEWDFNNDGIIDSYEQNPTWTFDEPGVYPVKVTLSSDSLSKVYTCEDSIYVFDGESAINFNETSSLVKVAPSEALDFTNEWTFEAWINPTSLHGKYILDKNSVNIYTNKRSSGINDNSLIIKLKREDGSILRFSTEDSSLTLNEWQQVAVAYSYDSQKMDIYINGIEQEFSIEKSSIFVSPIVDNVSDTLILGNNLTEIRGLKGSMDEVRFWNSFRTKEELDEFRYQYLSGSENNLSGYWNMNEGNGANMLDKSGNNNQGIINNAVYSLGIDYSLLVGIKELEDNVSQIPDEFALFQNYPNPFNPTTNIKYQIAKQGNVTLKVFDIIGNEITTLIDREHSPGLYEIKFDANKLTSGIYFYKISHEDYLITKKMLLIK